MGRDWSELKRGKRAVCTLCSKGHYKDCTRFGRMVEVADKNDIKGFGECLKSNYVPRGCVRPGAKIVDRRLEEDEVEDSEERALQQSPAQSQLNGFHPDCKDKLANRDWSELKRGKRAVCTLCSKGHYKDCTRFGRMVEVADKNDIKGFGECLKSNYVPRGCVRPGAKIVDRRLEEDEVEDSEEQA